tara:strand:- start:205 stop:471 length:267 start_codon:yes stop_codon:yes gene_type:complete
MRLPPVINDYKPSVQTILQNELEKADEQNIKLDKDNFLTTGSVCLQSADGTWFRLTVSNAGVLSASELTGTQIDSDGRPVIASTNPYV